jgi:hypothetical protein
MKRLIATVMLLALPAFAAQAETFTFKNTSKPIGNLMVPAGAPGGRPSGAAVFNLTSDVTFGDGKKTSITGQCAQWILPPDNQFGSSTVCKFSDATGDLYISRTTCETPGPASDCWGKLIGVGGAYKGRTGAYTFHNAQGSTGMGFWTD